MTHFDTHNIERLGSALHYQVALAAEQAGLSLNAWIKRAVEHVPETVGADRR